jgi:hypothetical protein
MGTVIPQEEAWDLPNKLLREAIPVVAHLVASDGCECKLNGMVMSVTEEALLLGGGLAQSSSFLTVSLKSPFSACTARCAIGQKKSVSV